MMVDVQAMPERITAWLRSTGNSAVVRSYELLAGGYSRVMARVNLGLADGSTEVLVMRGDPPPEMAMLESDRQAEWDVIAGPGTPKPRT